MTAFLYLTSMKIILTVCSLLLVASAGAQTDVTLFDRHIDAQGASYCRRVCLFIGDPQCGV